MSRPNFMTRLAHALRVGMAALFAPAQAQPATAPAPAPRPLTPTMQIRPDFIVDDGPRRTSAFDPARPAPGVVPNVAGGAEMAMDDATCAALGWAGDDALDEGLSFMGYPYLAQLTQRPEYRRPSEILAKEMTRRWMRIVSTGDDDKSEKLRILEAEFERLNVQDLFRQAAEKDGFFGRSQIYISVTGADDAENAMPLSVSKHKLARKTVELRLIEPIWTYPDAYNSNDPLRADFYKPQSWFVFGKRIHASRMLTFVSRDVPDILKPAYAFGGLSLSQMAKPYVDNWLRTRQSVSDAVHNFSVMVLKSNMAGVLNKGGAEQMILRAQLFNTARDNQGVMMLDKDQEDFGNVSMPLGGLDHLQAQSQEQMAAVTGIPLIVLLGITPTGLNASSDGELQTFYAWVEAQQATLFGPPLKKLLQILQLCKFGEIDPEIGFVFEPLKVLSETEKATVEKTKADTDAVLIDKAIIDPQEARTRLAGDDDSSYAGLDLTKEILLPAGEGDDGTTDPLDETVATDPPGAAAPTPPVQPGAKAVSAPPAHPAPAPAPAPAATPAPKPAMDAARHVRAAGVMFTDPDGRVLLLKRAGGDHVGEWCFPGGKIEEGELAEDAARRESDEEIGQKPGDLALLAENTSDEGVQFTTFACDVPAAFVPKLNEEHTGFAWAMPDDLPEPMHPGPRATIARQAESAAA